MEKAGVLKCGLLPVLDNEPHRHDVPDYKYKCLY